jgi:ferredoxin/flavodoxin
MTAIYYFSGSGNSLAVAKDLAQALGATLEPMAQYSSGLTLPHDAEAVGFVFPSHDFQAPAFVQSWLGKVSGLEGTYVFAVMTYGIFSGRGMRKFADLVAERGGRLAAGFAVMMPHNGIGSRLQPTDVRARLLAARRTRCREIVATVTERREATPDSESAVVGFLRNRSWKMLPGLFRFVGVLVRNGEKGLFYNADENCNGCGICARVCPVGNIALSEGRPVWGEDCVSCFACLHWCPQQAARLSTRDLRIDHQYQHPDVRVREMMMR